MRNNLDRIIKILRKTSSAIVLLIMYFFICYYLMQYIIGKISTQEIINAIPLLFICFLMIFAFISDLIPFNKNNRKEVEDYYINAKKAIIKEIQSQNNEIKKESNNKDSADIIELMLLNMKEIKEYYVLSKTMAKRSFTLSVAMCIFGVIVISLSIITMFFNDMSFIESLIPVIGGSIVEVIAGTSLVVYKKSLEQLNQYYEALHSNERYLSLVNLVDKLNDDKKDETYINIINSQLEKLK